MTDAELDAKLTDAYAEGRRDQLEEDQAEITTLRAALAQPAEDIDDIVKEFEAMPGGLDEMNEARQWLRETLMQPSQPASQEQEPQLESDEPDGPTPIVLEAHKQLAAWIRASPVQPVLAQPVKPASELQLAAQAVLDRWDSPRWDWAKQGPTADLMHALRRALSTKETT